ncbi:hypothetical protein B0H10DRAFT_2067069, partial [Mycena sp. CBHHK59/15]
PCPVHLKLPGPRRLPCSLTGAPTLPPSDLQPPKLTPHISDGPLAVKVRT